MEVTLTLAVTQTIGLSPHVILIDSISHTVLYGPVWFTPIKGPMHVNRMPHGLSNQVFSNINKVLVCYKMFISCYRAPLIFYFILFSQKALNKFKFKLACVACNPHVHAHTLS